MQVKICGITKIEDALAAIDAGADYLGFNFYPKSPRYLTPERCAELQSEIRNQKSQIKTVGIFVNESVENIERILQQCGLDLAQLHGEETPEIVAALAGRAFKAFRGTGENHAAYAAARNPSSPGPFSHGEKGSAFPSPAGRPPEGGKWARGEGNEPAFLVDAYSATHYGGTGHTADWHTAQPLAAQYPLFLAGGLTPENVAQAIQQVQPWGVDVASGVESAPGVKDLVKVRAFVTKAKHALTK